MLVAWYPVGYETITWYAPAVMTFLGSGVVDVFVGFFRSGPLFYVLMCFLANVSGANAFVLLKVVGPLLYGSLVVSFFMFLRRGLKFDWKVAFVAVVLLAFQVAALRESWDRFRTVLGLGFLFAALTALRGAANGGLKWGLLAVFGLLTVLSRDYVGVVLFVSVLGFVVLEKNWGDGVRSLVALVPAFVVFAALVFPRLPGYWVGAIAGEFASRGYVWVVQDAFVIFVVCYLLLLPFVVLGLRGRRRDWLVGSMLVWLLFASFSVVGGALFSVPGYQRWLMLLVFPFCVYAVWGFERLGLFSGRRLWGLVSVLLVFVVVGAGYSTGVFSYVGLVPNSYVAVNLVQSSIPWGQVDDVKAVLAWLDVHAVSGSAVLVAEGVSGWVRLFLDRASRDLAVLVYADFGSAEPKLKLALDDGYARVYLVSLGDSGVDGFSVVYCLNSVSVSEYSSAVVE